MNHHQIPVHFTFPEKINRNTLSLAILVHCALPIIDKKDVFDKT